MIIACGEVKDAKWELDAQGDFRTLVISNGKRKEEKLRFRLDDDLYLYCSDILIFVADTDDVENTINEIMIALL